MGALRKAREHEAAIPEPIARCGPEVIEGDFGDGEARLVRVVLEPLAGQALAPVTLTFERVEGKLTLRRGFRIEPGTRCLMVEDIVTTGLSSRECIAAIAEEGGMTVGACCLIDRSGGKADVGVPLTSLARLDIPTYPADALPPELASIPADKPGSRSLAAR